MNDDYAFEQATREWLEDGPDRTPAATIDAVLLAVRTTPQERDLRIPWRTVTISRSLRLVAAITVIVVTGVAAFNLFGPTPGVGGTSSPSPAVTPSAPAPTPSPGYSPAFTPPANFVAYLAGYGQEFTPAPVPPSGVVSAHEVVAKLRADGFPSFAKAGADAQPIYGMVTCIDPTKNCAERGLVRPGQALAIWLVGYPAVSGADGGTAWATVDARTGAFINGDGPPGG